MANTKISQLPVFTGDTTGSFLVLNDATNTTTYKVSRETLFSGSLEGTASFAVSASQASNAQTASYVLNAVSASYILNAVSASNAQTSSLAINAISASNAQTASLATFALTALTASFLTPTASYVNPLVQAVSINGSINLTGPLSVSGSTTITGSLSIDDTSFTGAAATLTKTANSTFRIQGSGLNDNITIGPTNRISLNTSEVQVSNNLYVAVSVTANISNTTGLLINNQALVQNNDTRTGLTLQNRSWRNDGAGGTSTINNVQISPTVDMTLGTTIGTVLLINPSLNTTGGTSTVRGLYYNPTVTSSIGITERAIETVRGDVLFGTTSGNVGIGTTSPISRLSNTGSQMSDGGIGTSTLGIQWSLADGGYAAAIANTNTSALSYGLLVKTEGVNATALTVQGPSNSTKFLVGSGNSSYFSGSLSIGKQTSPNAALDVNGNVILGSTLSNTHQITGSLNVTGSTTIVGNLTSTGTTSITGSLFGTASWAINAVSTSVVVTFVTSSNIVSDYTGSLTISGSLTVTGSLNAATITGSLLGTASLATTASFALNTTQPTSGKVIYVDANSPNATDTRGSLSKYNATYPFTTIQAAVNVASNRDSIWVYPGTYNESIMIGMSGSIPFLYMLLHSGVTIDGGSSFALLSGTGSGCQVKIDMMPNSVIRNTGNGANPSGSAVLQVESNSGLSINGLGNPLGKAAGADSAFGAINYTTDNPTIYSVSASCLYNFGAGGFGSDKVSGVTLYSQFSSPIRTDYTSMKYENCVIYAPSNYGVYGNISDNFINCLIVSDRSCIYNTSTYFCHLVNCDLYSTNEYGVYANNNLSAPNRVIISKCRINSFSQSLFLNSNSTVPTSYEICNNVMGSRNLASTNIVNIFDSNANSVGVFSNNVVNKSVTLPSTVLEFNTYTSNDVSGSIPFIIT